jgi:hypothetical protein
MLPDNIGGATHALSAGFSRVSPVINDTGAIRAESRGLYLCLYLCHRFREVLEHLELLHHWKFLPIELA